MPVFLQEKRKRPKTAKELVRRYDSFRKGLNTFLLDNELNPEEIVESTNMRLVGKGILEPRGGTDVYYQANTGSTVRFIKDYYKDGALNLLSIGDDGWLTKKSGASFTRINGASFTSGARPEGALVQGKMYLVDGVQPMSRYDGTTLLTYQHLSEPTNLTATKSSGTSGPHNYSWRVSAESDVGETLATDAVTLSQLPENLTTTNFVTLSWSHASPTSSVRGYVIYGREAGAESHLARVPATVTSWIDDGTKVPSITIFTPDYNSTAGPTFKHVRAYKDLLVGAHTAEDHSSVYWAGTGPYVDKFTYATGGGYFPIEKNSQDRWGVTGLSEREGKLIIFKGQSIFQATLEFNDNLGINEISLTKLIDGVGCISSATVAEVENSVMFVAYIQGRGLALAKLDYEPNILSSVLRFQPISARVQSIIDQVNMSRVQDTWAVYFDKKYHWFLPVGGTSWTCLVYDVERTAFVGPWTLTNAWCGYAHLDGNNQYHFLLGKSNGDVLELSDRYAGDEDVDFTWRFRSKKDDFDRPFQMKIIEDAKAKLRNVSGGTVNVQYIVEGRDGIVSTVASETAVAPVTRAGWGSRPFALNARWGYMPSTSSSNSNVVVKYTQLNQPNILSTQVDISGKGSRAQILAVEIAAREMSRRVIPNEWRQ